MENMVDDMNRYSHNHNSTRIDYDYIDDQDYYMLNDPDPRYINNYDDDEELNDDDYQNYDESTQSTNHFTVENSSINNNYSTSTQNSFTSSLLNSEEFLYDQNDDYCFIENSTDDDLHEPISLKNQMIVDCSNVIVSKKAKQTGVINGMIFTN